MRVPLIAAFLSILLPLAAMADATEATLLAQGQRAFLGGDYDTSAAAFAEVLRVDPHNAIALKFISAIHDKKAGIVHADNDPLVNLTIPTVNLKDATFAASLDFLKHEAALRSVNVSFVSQLPAPQMDKPVTLSLTNVPFLEALRYLCTLNNAVYRIDPYAIVILPAPAVPAATPATDSAPQ
jgi:hypothetical protein